MSENTIPSLTLDPIGDEQRTAAAQQAPAAPPPPPPR